MENTGYLRLNEPAISDPTPAGTTIPFTTAAHGWYSLVLYDLFGNCIFKVSEGEMSAGDHQVTLNTSTLDPGLYLCTLVSSSAVLAKRISIVR